MSEGESPWAGYPDPAFLGLASSDDRDRFPRFFPADADARDALTHPFYKNVIFMCTDFERDCNRNAPQLLTEIGISYLDMANVKGPPGDRGINYIKQIKSEHIVVQNHLHVRGPEKYVHKNHITDFCQGVSDKFAFGHSKFKKYEDLKRYLSDKFRNIHGHKEPKRHVILVVWDKVLEEQTIKELDLNWIAGCTEAFDFQKFYPAQYIGRQIGLAKFLSKLGINPGLDASRTMHNAGNDAAFELQAFLAGSYLIHDQIDELRGLKDSESLSSPIPTHHYKSHQDHNAAAFKKQVEEFGATPTSIPHLKKPVLKQYPATEGPRRNRVARPKIPVPAEVIW
ncbi:Hypothetical protein D9617_1g088120 [Elsinoe fawcettii]|nr:Hypothetical protein D9617_1g088120 [Elsinoe fawcettii]